MDSLRPGLWLAAAGLLAGCVVPALAAGGRAPAEAGQVLAGAAVVDDTWHVGAGAGQYADDGPGAAGALTGGPVDPNLHSTKKVPSYGIQSRLSARAIVVQGGNGERVALVKTDNYLAQDLLVRRVGQLLAAAGSKVTYDHILYGVTHDHSSPYYATPAAGVWLFQDVFDLREFEFQARAMARAIETAEARLRPARMGATTVPFSVYKSNIVGPAIGDDGSPAGYPFEEGDHGLVVMRFDDISGPTPKPIATWINWGEHPESLDSYNLISADYLAPLERYIDRETGAPLIFSQGDVGSSEGPYEHTHAPEQLPDGVWRVWAHAGYAQAERGARYLADAIEHGRDLIDAGQAQVPYSSDFPVKMYDRWTPGPLSHPYPSVSNCRSQPTIDGDPGAPVLGLPDCQRADAPTGNLAPIAETLKAEGLPVPDNYDAPSFGAVEENVRIHLQALRLGEVLLASCSCEAQVDLIKNLESRTDRVPGNIYDGYAWDQQCTPAAGRISWTCPDPRHPAQTLTLTDAVFQHMKAEIHNDARGWDDPANVAAAESEPADPARIFGNFTKEELPPDLGYTLPVGVGHAGDYNGYTVSFREYQSRDSYRKALTDYGPHTADYMVTRLVRMAGFLKGGPDLAPEPTAAIGQADEARQEALATALGQAAAAAYDHYDDTLADDVGPFAAVSQPRSIHRFDATTFTWRGGDNAVDVPTVRVERQTAEGWAPYADQTGEVQLTLALPEGVQGLADARTGRQEWRWTANFEAYDGFPARLGSTPAGSYRFVVDGISRSAGANRPYHLESAPFTVAPWAGITVSGLRAMPDGSVSFVVDPIRYPRTYTSTIPFVADDQGDSVVCRRCAFRPWATSGAVASAMVTVVDKHGRARLVAARLVAGRWVADTRLRRGETAYVARGGIRDSYGELNGSAAGPVTTG